MQKLLKISQIIVKLTPIFEDLYKDEFYPYSSPSECVRVRNETPNETQVARWEFSLSSGLVCFPRILSRDFTDVPFDKELISHVRNKFNSCALR